MQTETHHYDQAQFTRKYHYPGELGALYRIDATEFRVWAPLADQVELVTYQQGQGGMGVNYPMSRDIQGTWVITLEGDLNGLFYTYHVTNFGLTHEIVDPYAKAVGVNGERGMVIDLRSTNPAGWDEVIQPPLTHIEDAILYELHVRDFSQDPKSGIKNKGKYLAFSELGTTGPHGVATGIDHLKELGITHVHLMPIYDFATVDESDPEEYNWGYDPLNFNAPEGSYSSDPFSGAARIYECKHMIKSLMDAGIRVVMDVVYNHTYHTDDSWLNRLAPGYFYRLTPSGEFSNGSGVGNELASERSMVRKFIIDSVIYWAREYKISGFRFDLMGLIDIETMNEIRRALDDIDPSIIIYGEGWTGGLSPLPDEEKAVKGNVSKMPKIAVFSDDSRDGIKGHVFHDHHSGFINGGHGAEETIKFGVVAATSHPHVDYSRVIYSKAPWANQPIQCINYADAHDNLNLWDKISRSAHWANEHERLKMHKLALAIVLTSQGIPFLHAGSEFVRTKKGEHNSYNLPDDINQILWANKARYYEHYQYVRGLIHLRKSHPAFRMRSVEDIRNHLAFLETKEHMVVFALYNYANRDSWETIVVAYNANADHRELGLPGREWAIVVDGLRAGISPLRYYEGERLRMPGRSCYVLVNSYSFARKPS